MICDGLFKAHNLKYKIMAKDLKLKATLNASPETVYHAWLNSGEHTKMTGNKAVCSDKEGAKYSAWDQYITGKNLELKSGEKIVQTWRSTDFAGEDADSQIEVHLKKAPGGCLLTLIHTGIPDNQPDYEEGWREYYFKPMKEYFGKKKE